MSSREVIVWLDERWYKALSRQLKDVTLEEHLKTVLDEMCNALPEREYARISSEIYQENIAERQAAEAAKKFAAFRIVDHGKEEFFQVDRNLGFLDTARLLRSYLRNERGASSFSQMLYRGEHIAPERYDELVRLRLDDTEKVTGVFKLDFDSQRMSALHIKDSWQTFTMADVSTAAYYANRKQGESEERRRFVFLERLEGKELHDESPTLSNEFLTGTRRLRPEDVSLGEEIIQNDHLLEFYMEVVFDPEEVFGLPLDRENTDDYINVYANYDMEHGSVADTLEVYLVRGGGSEQAYQYRLNAEEQAALLPKMEVYCQQRLGQSLSDCCRQYQAEEQGPGMTMN